MSSSEQVTCCCYHQSPFISRSLLFGSTLFGLYNIRIRRYPFVFSGFVVTLLHSAAGNLIQAQIEGISANEELQTFYNKTLPIFTTSTIPLSLLYIHWLFQEQNQKIISCTPLIATMYPYFIDYFDFKCDVYVYDFCMITNVIALFMAAKHPSRIWLKYLTTFFTCNYILNRILYKFRFITNRTHKLNINYIKSSVLNILTVYCM